MPNDLINTDPIVSQNFFLEIDGDVVSILSGVSGLDVEVDVVTTQQAGKDGKVQTVKTVGSPNKAPDLQLTRMAPADAANDKLWQWFGDIRGKGFGISDRAGNRKNGSIVLYDTTGTETGRFNFFNGWPSKISTDSLSVDSNEALKETVTLVCERIERVK
jgi:phage tail-like protein